MLAKNVGAYSCFEIKLLNDLGRPTALINIDPANENVPYEADVDVAELIQLEDVMRAYKLGPNGGLVYCMEYLEKNLDWLLNKIQIQLKATSFSGTKIFLNTVTFLHITLEKIENKFSWCGYIHRLLLKSEVNRISDKHFSVPHNPPCDSTCITLFLSQNM